MLQPGDLVHARCECGVIYLHRLRVMEVGERGVTCAWRAPTGALLCATFRPQELLRVSPRAPAN